MIPSFDVFGDCIGLSPIIFGKEGPYVQSDMQYAQQVQVDIRSMQHARENGLLKSEVALELMTRFYAQDGADGTQKVVASEIHLEEDNLVLFIEDDDEEGQESGERIKPE